MIQFSTSNRTSEEKVRIIFDMCMDETHEVDESSEKTVDKFQLMDMLSSFVNLAKTNHVNDKDIQATIESLFEHAGLKHKKVCNVTNIENMTKNLKANSYITIYLTYWILTQHIAF